MKDKVTEKKPTKIEDKKTLTCDHEGGCKNNAYKKVYPSWMSQEEKDKNWSYLCKKHFEQEKKALKENLGYSDI